MDKVAVVTGSNKGIGYAIVKGLCSKFPGIVYVTARNETLGKEAVEKINVEVPASDRKCSQLLFHQLDITNLDSINNFKDHIKSKHGGLDILVNNAGIAYKVASTAPFAEQAEVTNNTNFFGTLNLCRALFPLLRPHARVVHVSSRAGLLKYIRSDQLKARLLSDSLTSKELCDIVNDFVKRAQDSTHVEAGFPNSSYGMSKIAMTALGRIQQRDFDKDSRPDLIINSCCPGYVATDMSSHKGPLTIDEGAITPLFLALLPENAVEPKGKFYAELKEFPWSDENAKFL